ncbi:Metallo-hydrolase/oxidoreductase [Xylariaceae sp. FL0662B]|nr:Metallo-hydrolase/oxidoreductase [Xylariaceae sp. FL0662B]
MHSSLSATLFLRGSTPPRHTGSLSRATSFMAQYSITVAKQAHEPSWPAPDEASEKRHHVRDQNGKLIGFRNPYPSAGSWQDITFFGTVRAALWARLRGKLTYPDPSEVNIPTVEPSSPPFRTRSRSFRSETPAMRITWVGHACCFVEFSSGLCVLFDPVFEDRCGPSQNFGFKRFTAPACKPTDFPVVDAVVISHSHYDHLSCQSIKDIASAYPQAHFFVGMGLARWFESLGIKQVTEMDWWENASLTIEMEHETGGPQRILAKVTCLPSQHASGRSASDKDQTLWASWAIASGGKSVWFAGDTGYRAVPELPEGVDDYGPDYEHFPSCPYFKQIGQLYGPFDLGLIPIGAYKPRYMFSGWHANPYDAVKIYRDTRCKAAVAIHWGTWALSTEAVDEPPKILKVALKKAGIEETGIFDALAIGESREV